MAYQKLQTREALEVITSNIVRIPDPNTVVVLNTVSGATVGLAKFDDPNTLTAVGTKFVDAGINVGAIVYNTTAGQAYYVVSVDSDTQLTLSGGAVGGANDFYSIYTKATIGCALFVGSTGDVKVQMAQQNGNTSVPVANRTVLYKNIANASFLPIQVVRVDANTTATDIIAMW